MKKEYKCCICNKILTKQEVRRLSKQRENGSSRYKCFVTEKMYDLCLSCHNEVIKYMKKLRSEKNKKSI